MLFLSDLRPSRSKIFMRMGMFANPSASAPRTFWSHLGSGGISMADEKSISRSSRWYLYFPTFWTLGVLSR